MTWNIKITDGDGKRLDLTLYDSGKFVINPSSPPSVQRQFNGDELSQLKSMKIEMEGLNYTKMECTRL